MKRLGIATVVFVIAIIIVWMIVYRPGPPEPIYQGQTLSEWLNRLRGDYPYSLGEREGAKKDPTFTACRNALLGMGSNAIPCLVEDLQAKRSIIEKAAQAMIDREVIRSVLPDKWAHKLLLYSHRASNLQFLAMYGFMVLGTNAAAARPQLIEMMASNDKYVRTQGLYAFVCSEPPKEVCMPVILRLLKDTDDGVRLTAARQLTELYPEEIETNHIYNLFPSLKPGYISYGRAE